MRIISILGTLNYKEIYHEIIKSKSNFYKLNPLCKDEHINLDHSVIFFILFYKF